MSHITVFSGTFCKEDQVVQSVLDKTGSQLITDRDLIIKASEVSGLSQEKIERAFCKADNYSIQNRFFFF